MTMKKAGKASFTGQKAIFLNMQQDGVKIRSSSFKNKKAYNRKDKSWTKD